MTREGVDETRQGPDFEQSRQFGEAVEFGATTTQYNEYRATYPPELFERLEARGVPRPDERILDLGTGTGFFGAELATDTVDVVGADIDRGMLQQTQDAHAGESTMACVQADAANLPFRSGSFDVVTAAQCWHWFDRDAAASEAYRVLVPGGSLSITHFDWLPLPGNVVEATEALVLEMNPEWPMSGGTGFYAEWPADVYAAGFEDVETFTFDVEVPYSHQGWRGRMQASAGVAASLCEPDAREFDERLASLLESEFPTEPLRIPHRSFTLLCRKPKETT
jgi:ubiquinone/menaquinone biosynthesis C-methylase UbiE